LTVTPYATEVDVEAVWSAYGIALRIEDEDDNIPNDLYLNDCLVRATCDINFYLLSRYTSDVIRSSTWVVKICASLASCYLGRRRGNGCPESLTAECQDAVEKLKLILSGSMNLILDDGIAPPKHDDRPLVTNPTIDLWWNRTKIRRIPETSTGGTPPTSTTDWPARSWPYDASGGMGGPVFP